MDFLSYHGDRFRKNENHLIILKGDHIFAVFPLALFDNQDRKEALSPYGASFGGVVFNDGLSLEQSLTIIDLIDEYFREKGISLVRITLPPVNYYQKYSGLLDYSLLRKGYILERRDIFHVLTLEKNYKDQFEKYEGRTRTVLRKTEGRFILEENVPVSRFYPVLLEDKARLNSIPTHSMEDLERLQALFPESIYFTLAINKSDNSKSAVCYFVSKPGKVIMTFYIAQETRAVGSNGTTFLLDIGIRTAIEREFGYFDFGSSTFGFQIQNIGLARFKESFGATGFNRDSFIKHF